MSEKPLPIVETDSRFPSGPWTGYYLQPGNPGRHRMEMRMKFANGAITGEGRDWVGDFILRGKYNTADHGQGIRGGSYVIRISGFDGKEANEAPFGQALFPEYQEQRALPKENSKLDINVPGKKKAG